jgi:hypothetical protein
LDHGCSNNKNIKNKNARRYQPYSLHHRQQQQQEEEPSLFDQEDSLFGPVPEFKPNMNISPPSTSPNDSCFLLDDSEVFDEFDQFMDSSSPARFLSSPPLSPVLTPNDDDVDFIDFALF